MSSRTFILLGVTYYILALIIIVIVLHIISKKTKGTYQTKINDLEREKNLIISANILTELNKVESLINNDTLRKKFDDWSSRFKDIKEKDIPKISDELIELEELYSSKKYKELKEKLAKVEYEIYFVKTKSNYLLNEIREITLSNDRNRNSVTKLKAKYREIVSKYNNSKEEYESISSGIDLQFERIDKLFSAFEIAMDNNNYSEVNKIVKGLEDLLGNLELVIEEAPSIVMMGTKLIPTKINDIENISKKMEEEGFNLDYLNIPYNIEESNKKITDILERLKVLNIEDSTFDLKTIMDYFDSIYVAFDKEKEAQKSFEEYMTTIIARAARYSKINNDLRKKSAEYKYSYDLTDDDFKILSIINQEIQSVKKDYERIINSYRSRTFSYTKLDKEMDILNTKLIKIKEKLDAALKSLGSLKEDEARARDQLVEIKEILRKSQIKISTYKLPVVPKKYYVELAEATESIKEMVKELNKQPISIKTLNIRVDTARDLVLKLYSTSNELVKTAYMAEMAVVYGNRFRIINESINDSLSISENYFFKGEFKKSLENSINAINKVEPDFYKTLMNIMEESK
ncbi:MAG: septation ring formation regulator EzrA [Bacilli bacterium]|nr:septation ring formation regulator EzrA [Bacilli bacterium]